MIIIGHSVWTLSKPEEIRCMARLVVIGRRPTGKVAKPPRPARQDFGSCSVSRAHGGLAFSLPAATGSPRLLFLWITGCEIRLAASLSLLLWDWNIPISALWPGQLKFALGLPINMPSLFTEDGAQDTFSSGIGYRRACIAWAFRQAEWKVANSVVVISGSTSDHFSLS
jgi:hypothetical protein